VANPAFNADPPGIPEDRRDDTVRLWLSQRQWMSVLEGTERRARQADFPREENLRQNPRLPAPQQTRCMIRLGQQADHSGTFMVKLRDVSTTGLGFFSAQPFTPKSLCTVALQDGLGHGLVAAARIVWCRSLDEQHYDVGIQLDQPIHADWFATDTQEDIPC